jgi:hypothetical protein
MRMTGIALLVLAFAAPRENLVLGTPAVDAPLSHENLSVFILEDTAARSPGEWITLEEGLAGFMKALGKACDGKEKAVGLVTAVNRRLSGADLYVDPGLFRKLDPRLLASAALEAISVPSREPKALTAASVLKCPAAADRAKPAGTASLREGARTLQFRTMHGGMEPHRQSPTEQG